MMLSEKKLRLVLAFALGFIVAINIKFITDIETIDDNTTNKNNPIRSSLDAYNNDNDNGNSNSNNSNNGNSSPLDGIRILVAITAFDFSQIPHLEEVIDSYQDLCVTSVSKIDIVIYTTHAYPVTLIDLWNNRINPSCKRGRRRQRRKQQHDAAAAAATDVDVDVDSDIESSSIFSMTIIVKPYSMRLFLVDCHRYLFYDKIDDYDLFIYTEDDMIVRPKLIASYIDETDRVIDIVGLNKSQDFNVGIVRYEYNFPSNVVIDDNTRHSTQNVTRVYWEHMDKPIFPKTKKTKGGSSGY